MRFVKMEGLGNDYLYLNCLDGAPPRLPELAKKLSDRHFGVGADGLICIFPGKTGDFTMEMYNADGSRGAMCGNGLRCVGRYVYDRGLTKKRCLTIDTDVGQRHLELHVSKGQVTAVTADMGTAEISPAVHLQADGEEFTVLPVSVGNPHAVVFCSDPALVPLERWGALLERHPALGEGRNVEFAALPSPDRLTLRVWERGSGVTLSCGTGACAAFAAARETGRCQDKVTAVLPGGELALEWMDGHLYMTGPARFVFQGETL